MGTKSCRYSVRSDAQNPSGNLRGRMPKQEEGLGQSSPVRSTPFWAPFPGGQNNHTSPHELTSPHSHPPGVASSAVQPSNGGAWDRGMLPLLQQAHSLPSCHSPLLIKQFFFFSFSLPGCFLRLGRLAQPASQGQAPGAAVLVWAPTPTNSSPGPHAP